MFIRRIQHSDTVDPEAVEMRHEVEEKTNQALLKSQEFGPNVQRGIALLCTEEMTPVEMEHLREFLIHDMRELIDSRISSPH